MSPAGQLGLPLDWREPAEEAGFIVSAANAAAVRHLEHLALWPVMTSVLAGPPRSGRSLLGQLFARRTGARLIDDVDRADEQAVFHAWNEAQASRTPLLLIAGTDLPWRPRLPDLRSRIAASSVVTVEEPDDPLIEALILRGLGARGLAIGPEVVRWLLPRVGRSYRAIEAVVDALDGASLAEARRITIPFAKSALASVIDLSHESL